MVKNSKDNGWTIVTYKKIKKIKINKLPIEIQLKIFSYVEGEDLYKLKNVCSYWYKLINNFLIIEKLNIPDEREQDALIIYNSTCTNGTTWLSLYRSLNNISNIINKSILNNQVDYFSQFTYENKICKHSLYDLHELDYIKFLEKIKGHSICGAGVYGIGIWWDDPEDVLWRTIIGLTGLEYSLEELKNKPYDDEFIKSFMNKYKWYTFKVKYYGMWLNPNYNYGIITLYPDKKTFTMLFAYDYD